MTESTPGVNTAINWTGFLEKLENQVLAAEISGQVLALIAVSLRQLPIYNFRLGFRAGEHIVEHTMVKLGEIITRAVSIDRIAPDKIAVIIPDVAVPELLSISARKIVDHLAEPFLVNNEIVSVSATVGVSVYPEHGTSAEALISESELSLHSSVVNAQAFHIPARARSEKYLTMMQMGSDLQTAIADENLSLHYQPKLDLHSLKPVAAETLMRWSLHDGSRISPEEFIPVAEASGSIFKLTEWAINTALREGGDINGNGTDYSVAVNLSAGTIYDPSLIHIIQSALAIWDLPPELLVLEVTESSLMKDPKTCFRHLSQIRDEGVRISIDDFGTGFSSLSYFKDIPADEIKVDQAFVRHMCESAADEKIVGLIIDLSHKFNLKVVAEGVENEQTFEQLRHMGCDVGQGFYFARPMELEAYRTWLEKYDQQPLSGR